MATNDNYGYILNKSDIRTNLLGRGAYKSALESLDVGLRSSMDELGKQTQISQGQAFQDYGDTLEQAYISAQQNKNAVNASSMFSGYKKAADSNIDAQLDQIYEQASAAYQQNLQTIADKYLSSANELTDEYSKNVNAITTSAEGQAESFDKYWQSHLKYYDTYLRENLDADRLKEILTKKGAGKYYIEDWFITDDDGNTTLKSVDDLIAGMTEATYDENGKRILNTTDDAIKFIQMLEDIDEEGLLKDIIGEDYLSFSDWLRNKDYETYEWSVADQELGFGSGRDLFRQELGVGDKNTFSSFTEYKNLSDTEKSKYLKKNKDSLLTVDKKKSYDTSSDIIKELKDTLYSNLTDDGQFMYTDFPIRRLLSAVIHDENLMNYIGKRIDLNKEVSFIKDNSTEHHQWYGSNIWRAIENAIKDYYSDPYINATIKLYGESYTDENLNFVKKQLGI